MSYDIRHGEAGAMTFEPYKSDLLPLWRFSNALAATKSCNHLWERFLEYNERGDFVGMDMARKFIEMGLTRARRYIKYKGGRTYDDEGNILPESDNHAGREEMKIASRIFQKRMDLAKRHQGYNAKKKKFMREKRVWNNQQREERAKAIRKWNHADSGFEEEDQNQQ